MIGLLVAPGLRYLELDEVLRRQRERAELEIARHNVQVLALDEEQPRWSLREQVLQEFDFTTRRMVRR